MSTFKLLEFLGITPGWIHPDIILSRNSVQVMPDCKIVFSPVWFCMFDNLDHRVYSFLVTCLELRFVIPISEVSILFSCNTMTQIGRMFSIIRISTGYNLIWNVQWHHLLSMLEHKCTFLNCVVWRIFPDTLRWLSSLNESLPIATPIWWVTNHPKKFPSICVTYVPRWTHNFD